MTVRVQRLTEADIPATAALFAECFRDSVLHHCRGRLPKPAAMEDIFAFVRRVEPAAAFGIWSADDRLCGYCFAPTCLPKLWRSAFGRDGIWRWTWRWLCGDYGIGLWPIKMIAMNKLNFLRSALRPGESAPARILSIAVEESARGKGCAQELLTAALRYQAAQGVRRVRLEVRPENGAARRLYERNGFRQSGVTADSQGQWLIMWKEMANDDVGSESALT